MKIGFAQINPTVGDLEGNFQKIATAYDQLAQVGADIVIAPELAVTGYPPQDLLFKSRFVPENLAVLDRRAVEQLAARGVEHRLGRRGALVDGKDARHARDRSVFLRFSHAAERLDSSNSVAVAANPSMVRP